MTKANKIMAVGLLLCGFLLSGIGGSKAAPVELGKIQWGRDFGHALVAAQTSGKPVFVLFQEVPGCQTCLSFGEQVLSHPLLVEAIEPAFEPVFVYNNKSGKDAEILRRYGEPAWNNPVVRFLDQAGKDLLPRRTGIWTPYEIGTRMVTALEHREQPIPTYLRTALDELRPRRERRASFAMPCFWSGEACVGQIPGLLGSRVGFLEGREVVEVRFDPDEISYATLFQEVHRRGCASSVFVQSKEEKQLARSVFGEHVHYSRARLRLAKAADQKYALQRTSLRLVDLSQRQALRANATIAIGNSPVQFLSPRQQAQAGLAATRETES